MLLSDLVLGYTRYGMLIMLSSQPVVYAFFVATTGLGQLIRDRRSAWRIGRATLGEVVLYFVVTILAVWTAAVGHSYPRTGSGLRACYAAGLPFFRNSLLGDAVFTAIMFGGLAQLENRVAWMRKDAPPVAA
jgi:hypothetical protein